MDPQPFLEDKTKSILEGQIRHAPKAESPSIVEGQQQAQTLSVDGPAHQKPKVPKQPFNSQKNSKNRNPSPAMVRWLEELDQPQQADPNKNEPEDSEQSPSQPEQMGAFPESKSSYILRDRPPALKDSPSALGYSPSVRQAPNRVTKPRNRKPRVVKDFLNTPMNDLKDKKEAVADNPQKKSNPQNTFFKSSYMDDDYLKDGYLEDSYIEDE
jgi:hypothetical protein